MSLNSLPKTLLKAPFKLGLGTLKAFKEAFVKTTGGISKRAGVLAQSMIDSVHKIYKDREKAKEASKKGVKKSIDKTTQGALIPLQLDDSLTQAEKDDVQKAWAEAMREYDKTADKDTKKHAESGADKAKKNKEDLTIEEQLGLSANAMITLTALRKKFPTKAKFKKVLESLNSAANRNKVPFQRLLNQSMAGLLNLKDEKAAMTIIKRLHLQPQTEAMAKIVAKIGKGLDRKELSALIESLKSHLLKNTSSANIRKFLTLAKKLIKSSKDRLNVSDFTDFVFYVDTKDYAYMIGLFTGKANSPAKKGA